MTGHINITAGLTALVFLCAACDQDVDLNTDGDAFLDTIADTIIDTTDDPAVDPVEDTAPDTEPEVIEDTTGDTYDGVAGTFTNTHASRQYQMYVPAGYSASTPIAVMVGFHGAGDSGANFYNTSQYSGWTEAADAAPFILVVPDTKSPYSDFAIWSGDPMNDFDEMSTEMTEVLALIAEEATHYNIDLEQIYAYGFSDGGLFLGVAGMQHASSFSGFLIAGYGWGAAYAQTPPWLIPVFMTCGQSDSFYSYADATQSYLVSQGHPVQWVPVPSVGHTFSALMSSSPPSTIWTWLSTH